jgi:hypothetical protein
VSPPKKPADSDSESVIKSESDDHDEFDKYLTLKINMDEKRKDSLVDEKVKKAKVNKEEHINLF